MGRFLRTSVAVSVLLGPVGSGAALQTGRDDNRRATRRSGSRGVSHTANSPADPRIEITVLIYNYAGARRRTVSRATRAAATVFRRIGVRTVWLECQAPTSNAARNSPCDEQLRATHLALRILSRTMAERARLPRRCFGYAMPARQDRFGHIANVFYHRVDELAESRGDEERPIILGHMMAHELGHLLLGVDSHSDTGIMHVPWGPRTVGSSPFQ